MSSAADPSNGLPTAVIDKSVFQRIAELSSSDRRDTMAELLSRFRVIIPFVLVEEVLVNRGQLGPIPRKIVETMFRELMRLRDCWVDDEPGWIFDELVAKDTSRKFKPVPEEFLQRVAGLRPDSPGYQAFLVDRKNEADRDIQQRITNQDEAAQWRMEQKFDGELWFTDELSRIFCLLPTEKDFFNRFVSPGFHARDRSPGLWFEMMNPSLGRRMRVRYPNRADEIERSLREVTSSRLFECPITLATVLAKSFYFWAPLVRIGNHPSNCAKIIGRKRSAQRGNIHDERYIAVCLLCDSILTRDAEMARMAGCFSRCDLWLGTPTYLPADKGADLRTQIATLPKPARQGSS